MSLPTGFMTGANALASHYGEIPIRRVSGPHHDLRQLGISLTQASETDSIVDIRDFNPRSRTRENAKRIYLVVQTLNRAQQQGETTIPAGRWLLDNTHIIEEAIAAILRDLPPRFYRQLHLSKSESDVPRTLAIAWAYIADTDSAISARGFQEIVQGFQDIQPLNIGELWALPSLLRFVLVENLRRLAILVAQVRDMRLIANQAADQLTASLPGKEAAILSSYASYAHDKTFATQFLHRVRDGSRTSHAALTWLETALEAAGTDAEQITLDEHATLSTSTLTINNIIRSLRLLDDIDWAVWFEEVSHIDALLRTRTSFAALDFSSRDIYRTAIETLAARSGKRECEVALLAVEMAEAAAKDTADDRQTIDIGSLLIGWRRRELERAINYSPAFGERLRGWVRRSGWLGIALPVTLLTALFITGLVCILVSTGFDTGIIILLAALFLAPALEASVGLYNSLTSLLVEPAKLIGYEYKEGVPADAATFVVIPMLIATRDDIEQAIRDLEVHYLANMSGELYFALLSDWPDSDKEETAADCDLLDFAREQMAELNKRYPNKGPDRFYLLHRRRLYNEAEGCWMGWERKRGKLQEFNALLRGDRDTTFLVPAGSLPPNIQYVMTLDTDTRTMRDTVARLVGKLAHPLNRPVFDETEGRPSSGYSILQPSVTPSMTADDQASFFQRIFSVNRGIDPYVFTVSNVYQDLFGEGIFTGKGLYHIDAMETALGGGRIPENAVLSHDLLESAYARTALVTDVEVFEDYPTRYLADAARHHRWTRGDWQLLPWILNPRSDIPGLSRWMMIDNLRRSLTPILWTGASIAGWSLLPLDSAILWQLLLIATLFLPLITGLISTFLPRRNSRATLSSYFASFVQDVSSASLQAITKVVLIVHDAWLMGDAIARALYRLLISRRHLLEWHVASHHARSNGYGLLKHYVAMAGVLPIAAISVALPFAAGSGALPLAVFFASLWSLSPAIAWLISRPIWTEDQLKITRADIVALRRIARRTWLYFDTFVTDEHHMLPPDNFQEKPVPVVAHRTSPTNIGVYLLSTIAARDFGWISFSETVERLEQTLNTLEKMERYRGHLYNWYDTRSLRPLHPFYVSSVDSGNFAGHLITMAAACDNWAATPIVYLQGDFEGILDTAGILQETLETLPNDRQPLRLLQKRLTERIENMRHAVKILCEEPGMAATLTLDLEVRVTDISKLAQALDEEIHSPASRELILWTQQLERVCEAHKIDAHTDESTVTRLRPRLLALRDRARDFALEMDFQFLIQPERQLLSIGYRVEEQQLDEACYDLLASEARLTSLLAIAKGDLPTRHWFRLGRPVTVIGFSGALMSWSGSMFEYLMPPLVMKEPSGSILNQSSRLIIARQMTYGREKGVPWGISEAAYNARDHHMTYQYTNFGVPGLGLKRGLAQDTVIAPYASLLAAQYRPAEAVANLARLTSLGALGRYGFHDAVDFTPMRLPKGKHYAVVRNFMAHHHGMSIIAVVNAVFKDRMRNRFHADPMIEAAELLLQEKAPRTVPPMPIRAEASDKVEYEPLDERPDTRQISKPLIAPRAISVMSNGNYAMMLTATGTGYSRAGDITITRFNSDPSEEHTGNFLFITDPVTGKWWSATAAPRRAPEEISRTVFYNDRAIFIKTVGTIRSVVECVVTSECDGEARRITLWNDSNRDHHLEITSFAELALAPEATFTAHPAFSKMFIKTWIGNDGTTIFAERCQRLPSDPKIALAHFVTSGVEMARKVEIETDRRLFIGRGRSIANAAAFDKGTKLSGSAGFTLDPVMALRTSVRVPAHRKISLTFWTVVAATPTEVEISAGRLAHFDSFRRQAMLAWTRSQVQARHVGLSPAEAAGVQKLARYLLYPDPALRASAEVIAAGLDRQSALWPMAISGDFPIFALRIGSAADLDIIAAALRMQEYLRARNFVFDLVVVNEQASSYVQDLQQAIEQICESARLRGGKFGPRQHIFAVRRDLMDRRAYQTLTACANVVLHTQNGPILEQIKRAETGAIRREAARPAPVKHAAPLPVTGEGLTFWNGFGGFANEGREYVVRLSGDNVTPQPWINVIANRDFGFHTSSEGASFTWSRNSRDFQLTPWSNDPVSNRPGEGIYLHNLNTGESFSPLACLLRDIAATYETRHERGVSSFTLIRKDLQATLTQLVDPADPVKAQRLELKNSSTKPLRLRVYLYAEWVLGNSRARTAPYIMPARDQESGTLLARNPYHLDFGDRTAFLACDSADQSFTSDRGEFIGAGGSTVAPGAVLKGAVLSGICEAGRDPCAALACDISVAPGDTAFLHIVLGDAGSADAAAILAKKHLAIDFDARMAANRAAWDTFANALQVETPDPAFNTMINVWLPYQAFACRIRARAAFYQASGAYGFRDQLQDTLALLLHDPSLARTQILSAASRQFREGDVQHWWLPRSGAGVRTMISDGPVWLAYATHHYVKTTGEYTFLDEKVAFINGPALTEGQHDAFFIPEAADESASLYEHCARGLDLVVKRTGANGLPLILGGDWNDGMNQVGEKGSGTSVWLGWFLLKALRDFHPLAQERGDTTRASAWNTHANTLKIALETHGWDGEWYRRGTYDDGTPLGSAQSDECRIDSIAQSWAVLSGGGDPDRANAAITKAVELLVNDDAGIVHLFRPPFQHTLKEPGYIKHYPPGVRENGGQYTHAATWLIAALAELGRADDAGRLFSMVNPVNHARNEKEARHYRVEPYVVAADVYGEGKKVGRGGWTWYTGSAGWLYRVAVENILGIVREGDKLRLKPAVPSAWPGFTARLRIGEATCRISVSRDSPAGMTVNGEPVPDYLVHLKQKGEHEIIIRTGG